MEFYLSVMPLTKDKHTRHVINTLIDLSRNFTHTARIGYLDYQKKEPTMGTAAYNDYNHNTEVEEISVYKQEF
jgi:hypothetical protein